MSPFLPLFPDWSTSFGETQLLSHLGYKKRELVHLRDNLTCFLPLPGLGVCWVRRMEWDSRFSAWHALLPSSCLLVFCAWAYLAVRFLCGHAYASFRIPLQDGRNSLLHSSPSRKALPGLFWDPSSITVVILWFFPYESPCLAGSLHLGCSPELPSVHLSEETIHSCFPKLR